MTQKPPNGEPLELLMDSLADKDGMVRQKARASLVGRGKATCSNA